MKKAYTLRGTLLLAIILFTTNVFAQDYTQWRLPEGAKARFGKGWINDIEFSPTAHTVSVATTIGVWTYDVHNGKAVNLFTGDMGGANAIAYTSDGQKLVAAHWNRTVSFWDTDTKLPTAPDLVFKEHPGPIYAVAVSPNNRMVASGGADKISREERKPKGLIKVWDLETKQLLPILRYNSPVSTLAFSPNSRWLAGGSGDGTIRVWDAGTGDIIHEFGDHKESIWKVDFSPDSKYLLSVSLDGMCLLTNLVQPHEAPIKPEAPGTSIHAASFSPTQDTDSYKFATGSSDKRVRLWKTNANNGGVVASDSALKGHNDAVWILSFSRDGQNLASGSLDGTVRLWDLDLLRERFEVTGHTGGIKALAYTEDNRILACGTGLDGIPRLWDASTSSQLSTLLDHAGLNKVATFSQNGSILASGGDDSDTILLSDVKKVLSSDLDNSLLYSLTGNRQGVTALALSDPVSDSPSESMPKTLASGGMDARIHLLDIATNRKLKTLAGAQSTVTALTFDPNSINLFSGEEDGTVRIWDALSGIEQNNFKSSLNSITSLAFSTSLRFLAIGDEAGQIRLFDFAEERQKYIFTQHTRKITTLIFAENGNTLVSGSEDGIILLWDLNKATLLNIADEEPVSQQRHATPQAVVEKGNELSPQQIAETSKKSTVHLFVTDTKGNIFGSGTGFFVRPGYIATNYHVIENANRIYIKGVETQKEKVYVVESIPEKDESHDLAILKTSGINAPPLSLGNSDAVQTGETVYVVGNPKGLEGTFSKGIVSAIRTDRPSSRIQIDAAISPGSSGGAVLNSRGEVIGVATSGYRGEDVQNLNFVVPSNYLKDLLRRVK